MSFPVLCARLAAARPRVRAARGRRAAVAVVLVPNLNDEPELLFIQRARREGDRWSGHLAFPGGLSSDDDDDDRAIARRECAEEVGLALGEPFAQLDDVMTGRPGSLKPMRVRPFVFALAAKAPLTLERTEVADAFWVPLAALIARPRSRLWRRVAGVPFPFSQVRLHDAADVPSLWGLTLMMVDDLLRKAGARGARRGPRHG